MPLSDSNKNNEMHRDPHYHRATAISDKQLINEIGPELAKLLPAAIWPANFLDNQESRLAKLATHRSHKFWEG